MGRATACEKWTRPHHQTPINLTFHFCNCKKNPPDQYGLEGLGESRRAKR